MGERKRLGFIYLWNEKWLGGVYYTQNLFYALNSLDDEDKPIINVYCKDDSTFLDLQKQTQYPYIEKHIIKIQIWKKVYMKLLNFISEVRANEFDLFDIDENDSIIFPWGSGSDAKKLVLWKPDFQEKHLPKFFKLREIKGRDRIIRMACKRHIPIVFSSNDSRNDFASFYPEYKDNKSFVVHFAVSQIDFSDVDINVVKSKYGIDKNYILCANQFWQHKNHLFLFKAFRKALTQGLDLKLVCTGNMSDYRNTEYIDKLKKYIMNNNLDQDILTLGVIEKKDLLCLMKNSYAVIQPSLFEGWNTTVEDCKSMSKFIFLSDLSVHREQISKNVCFFNPQDEDDLVEKLLTVNPVEERFDYSHNLREFGERFLEVIDYIAESN